MLRWLLIALAIYMLYRLIRGPKERKQNGFTFHFGRFNTGGNSNNNRARKKNLDQIEEAEFEDITEKEIKTDK